jgi:hypothetical protein
LCREELIFPGERCFYRQPDAPAEWPWYRRGLEVLKLPIWCRVCNAPRYAERIPSLQLIELAVALRKLPNGYCCDGLPDDLLFREELIGMSVEDLAALATGLCNRRPPGNCLSCGWRSYIPIESRGAAYINLLHEPCDEQLEAWYQISSVLYRAGHRETVRWFDFSGQFLGHELV